MGYKKMIVDGKAVIAYLPRLGAIPWFLLKYDGLAGIEFKDATREEYLKLKRDASRKKPRSIGEQISLI